MKTKQEMINDLNELGRGDMDDISDFLILESLGVPRKLIKTFLDDDFDSLPTGVIKRCHTKIFSVVEEIRNNEA